MKNNLITKKHAEICSFIYLNYNKIIQKRNEKGKRIELYSRYITKHVDITPSLIIQIMKNLKKNNIIKLKLEKTKKVIKIIDMEFFKSMNYVFQKNKEGKIIK